VNEQLAGWLKTACIWEADAPKAGNVHPQASFVDLEYVDFVRSAEILEEHYRRLEQPAAETCPTIPLLEIASETRRRVGRNTNLGILLLTTPLAAVPPGQSLGEGVKAVLDRMDVAATIRLYEAIRVMQPGGMAKVDSQDLGDLPTLPVREVMRLATDRDLIAQQYVNNFADVLSFGCERLQAWWERTQGNRHLAVVGIHLDWMARFPDTLIARKNGPGLAIESAKQAAAVLAAGWPEAPAGQEAFVELDAWLRADGNKRNPGTSADMTAATLFAWLRKTGAVTRND